MLMFTLLSMISVALADSPHALQLLPRPIEPDIERRSFRPDKTVYGYLPYWSTSPSTLSMSGLTHVAYFGVELNADGSLSYTSRWTGIASTLVSRAHQEGVKVHLCLISFSDAVNNTVLPSSTLRAKVIQNLKTLINDYGADGVNIDIEGMDAARKQDLNNFIAEMSAQIPEIVIATPAVDWSNAYDYSELSIYADLFIMGYDYHWGGGNPGPVDPLFGGSPWGPYSLEWSVDDYLAMGTDPSRIILGLPLYGRTWDTVDSSVPGTSTGTSSSIVMSSAVDLANLNGSYFDTVTESPYILYPNKQTWFPNVASVESRVLWALDQNLQGVGFWALGYENGVSGFWEMMEAATVFDVAEPSSEPATEPSSEPSSEPASEGTNTPPSANAGLDQQVVVGSTVNLDGRLSRDVDGNALGYTWSFLDAQGQSIENPDSILAQFIPTTDGIWEIDLAVTDGIDTSHDRLTVTVLPQGIEEEQKTSGCNSTNSHTSLWLLALHSLLIIRRREIHAC